MRKNGWYRVKFVTDGDWELAQYISDKECWFVTAEGGLWFDNEFHKIDPQMVMTPTGEIVYHNAQHDPLYNTAQEQ